MDGSIVFARWRQCAHLIMVPWAHQSPQPKRHLDPFSCFSAGLTIITDRQTTLLRLEHQAASMYVVLRCGLKTHKNTKRQESTPTQPNWSQWTRKPAIEVALTILSLGNWQPKRHHVIMCILRICCLVTCTRIRKGIFFIQWPMSGTCPCSPVSKSLGRHVR